LSELNLPENELIVIFIKYIMATAMCRRWMKVMIYRNEDAESAASMAFVSSPALNGFPW
jgi:hypothetical protein